MDLWKTVFVDGGARYGLHPTMADYPAPKRVHAFEPDPGESAYLAEKYAGDGDYVVNGVALSDTPGTIELNVLGHRGMSTTRTPNAESLWLRDIRPDEGAVQEKLEIECTTLDRYFAAIDVSPDFIKLDIEGHELAALKGAETVLGDTLALNIELVFSDVFGHVPAPQILEFLLNEHPFMLVNLDYDGRGYPMSSMQPGDRFGVVVGCEAFFVRKPEAVASGNDEVDLPRFVKLAVFAFRNRAGDLACRIVEHEIAGGGRRDAFAAALKKDVPLARYLELLFLRHAHRIKNVNPDAFSAAAALYQAAFGAAYPDRERFFRRTDELSRLLSSG
ncbi:MAG: FkbM family methyltransferase [Rhodospirillales bacterium]